MALLSCYSPFQKASTLQLCKIVAVILGYWTVSISMVFANKYLVGDHRSKVDMSLFVAWMQCIVTVLVVSLLTATQSLLHALRHRHSTWPLCNDIHQWRTREVLLMTVTLIGMLVFNNLCLKHVGVAFFQVARSTTLIFVVIFSVVLLKKPISATVFCCCLCVAFGFVLGIDQEKIGSFSLVGVFYGVITSFFAALNGIFTKTALTALKHNSLLLTFLCNLNAAVILAPVMLYTNQLQTVLSSGVLTDAFMWLFLTFTGVLGFSIAWISAKQIDLTSPVTHHISANCKAVVQTLIAVSYFHDHKSVLWWISVLLVFGGATSYALVRLHEEKGFGNNPSETSSSERTNPSRSTPSKLTPKEIV